MASRPCLSGQVEPTLCGPLFHGATLRPHHQQLWKASHAVKGGPGKASGSISS
jgi:hypothetical protein